MLDVRTAAFRAIVAFLTTLTWENAGEQRRFATQNVFDTMPDEGQDLVLPAAAVEQLDGPIDYTGFTKSLAGEVVKGSGGVVVFKVGEWTSSANIVVWAESADDINAIVRALQDALNPDEGRLGLLLPMGEDYFNGTLRVTYDEDRADTDEDRARAGRRRTVVPVTIDAPYYQQATRPAMKPKRDLEVV